MLTFFPQNWSKDHIPWSFHLFSNSRLYRKTMLFYLGQQTHDTFKITVKTSEPNWNEHQHSDTIFKYLHVNLAFITIKQFIVFRNPGNPTWIRAITLNVFCTGCSLLWEQLYSTFQHWPFLKYEGPLEKQKKNENPEIKNWRLFCCITLLT